MRGSGTTDQVRPFEQLLSAWGLRSRETIFITVTSNSTMRGARLAFGVTQILPKGREETVSRRRSKLILKEGLFGALKT